MGAGRSRGDRRGEESRSPSGFSRGLGEREEGIRESPACRLLVAAHSAQQNEHSF